MEIVPPPPMWQHSDRVAPSQVDPQVVCGGVPLFGVKTFFDLVLPKNYILRYDEVSANGVIWVPKTSVFQSGHRL